MSHKIKILHIIPSLLPGGAEKMMVDLARFTNRELFSVEVLCLRTGGFWEDELRQAGVPFTVLGSLRRPIIFDFFKLVRFIRAAAPDIVHTHLFGADFYGRLAASFAGVKKIISTEQNLNWNENWLKKIAKRCTAGLAQKIIAASGAIKEYLINEEGVLENKIEVIPNGVELDKFINKSREYEVGEPIVGSIGRLSPQKGFDFLLEAAADIPGLKVLIAGEGGEKQILEKIAANLDITGRVRLVGVQKDVPVFLESLDIFVLPSRWEGFGIVLLEAGLSGLPVIASRIDGIAEIIKDGENGILFEPGNVAELAEKLKKLLADPAERARLGKNLQQRVAAEYDIKKIVKRYEAVYQKI